MYLHKWLIIIKLLLLNYNKKMFDFIEDKCYEIQANKKVFLDDIMYQVNNQKIVDITKPLIYLIRIWNRYDDKYAYKIGYSNNFSKGLDPINYECDSNYRIIILACANIDNIQIEKNIQKKMRESHKKVIIGNPIKRKPTKLYKITYEVYNDFINILKDMNLKYFQSNNYLFSKDDKLELFKDNKRSINIYLDQGINEQKYWLYKYIKFNELKYILLL